MKMNTQEEENEIYEKAQKQAAEIYDKIIHSVSPEIAESIANILQNGTEAEVVELSDGLWDLFKDR